MLVSGNEILDYIPQRPPVVMIDKLLFSNHEKTVSGLHIDSNNIFVENGVLSESGMVENIAQTAAAGVGYICKMENRKVPVGFIASIKDLKLFGHPKIGEDITTDVEITNQVMEVSIVKGILKKEGEILAECEMRIFIKPE